MKVTRVVCCLSVLLLSLLAFAFTFSTSTTTHAQGLPCTPVAQGNGSQTCTVNFHDAVTTFHVGPPPTCMISATITQTFNGLFHITLTKDRNAASHTSTMTAPFLLVPHHPTIPTHTRHTPA